MAMTTIATRLAELRAIMRREKLAAFIFPSTDPHHGEYVPDHWKGREWISGFDGSAGTAVVTLKGAALWTDSRYFIAAEEQLKDTEFMLMKERVEGTPSIAQWIGTQVEQADSTEVGIDGMVADTRTVENFIDELRREGGLTLRTNLDPLKEIWADRPCVPQNAIEIHPLTLAGEDVKSKLQRVKDALRCCHADGMLVSALDDIAWMLNIRGTDVHCNPVAVAYLLIAPDAVTLFTDAAKVTPEVNDYLTSNGVRIDDYAHIRKGIEDYFGYNILLDPDETNYTLYKAASKHRVVREKSPVPTMKAVKNNAEIEGFRRAMLYDGMAMCRFLAWLNPAVEKGGQTEMSVEAVLRNFREEQPDFRDISFDTISAYGAHGAIVHYEATPETDVPLKAEGLLLLDSGAQYRCGTTDITRTVALGALTDEQKKVYTLVLKGHIRLEMLKFPAGASGTQLDAVARMDMWREGMNYLHGTGHGVGSYLNVHEGPHQIRMEWKPTPLQPGMTVTDEPGIYLAGRFGVRIENTLLVTPYMETEFGRFLQFDSLTLCPIDKTPIVGDMLAPEEKAWLNDYHRHVYETLAPHLDDDTRKWLEQATQPL
ncbi:MAG: aminopeptidase P family protein [Prevotellaceae bacterium]|nr:aminopeptidase P family protein [Prevotellaceae bacterium]